MKFALLLAIIAGLVWGQYRAHESYDCGYMNAYILWLQSSGTIPRGVSKAKTPWGTDVEYCTNIPWWPK
jgi:hypothetical protein